MQKELTLGEKTRLSLEKNRKRMYEKYLGADFMTQKCMIAKAISEMGTYMSYGQLDVIRNTDYAKYNRLRRQAEEYMKAH